MKAQRYFILEEDGRSKTVINGVPTQVSNPTPVKNSPDGWRNAVVNWELDPKKHSIPRSFVTPFAFMGDEALILRDTFYKYGYEKNLQFLIQELTPEVDASFYRLIYRYLYRGEFDLTTFKDSATSVTCGLMEGGLAKVVKANEATVYDIPFDDDAIDARMDGVLLFQKHNFLLVKQTSTIGTFSVGLSLINSEGTAYGLAAFTTTRSYSPIDDDNLNYFGASVKELTEVNLKGTIPVKCITGVPGYEMSLRIYNEFSDTTNTIPIITTLINPNETIQVPVDVDFDMVEGDRLFLVSDGTTIVLEESNLALSYQARYKPTLVKAFKPLDLFRKLIERITGNADNGEGILLQLNANKVITSGDAIRGINGATIKTSLNDFYDHCSATMFAGTGIENNKVIIEARSHFYDFSNPIHLGKVKDLEVTLATDRIANTFKIGYPDPEVDDVNGKYAFNGSHTLSTDIKKVVKEFQILSPYGHDPYEIETIRINLDGKTTTDSNSDNKCYGLHVEQDVTTYNPVDGSFDGTATFKLTGEAANQDQYDASIIIITGTAYAGTYKVISTSIDGSDLNVLVETPPAVAAGSFTDAKITFDQYRLLRETYDNENVTDPDDVDYFGLPTPTGFNIKEMTPKRLELLHGPWIRSMMHPFDSSKIKFLSTQRNQLLQTIKDGVRIKENADVNVYSLGSKIFLPYYFDFETEVPTNLIELMEENNNRCFSFEWLGKTYKGKPVKMAQALSSEAPQKFKLLSAPDNDMTKLIH